MLSQSELDAIPGIGPSKKAALLKHFGSVKKLRVATIEDICEIPGFSIKTAESVKRALEANEKARALREGSGAR